MAMVTEVTNAADISASRNVPPKIRSAGLGWFGVGLLVLAGVVLGGVVFFFNPSANSFYPVCQFHRLTGLNCPGCGATRGLYALLHGHFLVALRDNALLMTALVIAPLRAAWWWWRGQKGNVIPAVWCWPFLVVLVVFAVLRNLPAFAFLSPA